jgi:hypothetical protein
LCYLAVAVAATNHFKAVLTLRKHAQSGKLAPLFPKKPGYKKNFSLLTLKDPNGHVEFELCPGVWITDRHGKRRAPDINLLCGNASDSPDHAELRGIWDAKYVYDEVKRLADTDVADFVYTFEELGSPSVPPGWTNVIGVRAFHRSGLLTNGAPSTERPTALLQRQVCETNHFPKNPTTRP